MPSLRTRVLRILAVLAALTVVSCAAALATVDRWFFTLSNPGDFDASTTPPAPDYERWDATAWAALPELDDGADRTHPDHPGIDQASAEAAVFYLHPTTWLGSSWNGPVDDPMVVEGTERGGTLIQASVFNACCAVYAPRYRQAHGHAFVRPNAPGYAALEVAFTDVRAAFEAFAARIGDRPFILAGHSQGAALGTRLLREVIADGPARDRLVAAYLIGAPMAAEDTGLPACEAAAQTGCVVGWNARGPDYEVGGFEFEGDREDTMARRLCVNPLSWSTAPGAVPAESHAGALFFDTPEPAPKPAFCDAECRAGALVITQMGDLERDVPSQVLLWLMGPENYHPVEYQLFYLDLRRNAATRVAAKLATMHDAPEATP